MSIVVFGDPRLPERFWAKVYPTPGGCWRWMAARSGHERTYGCTSYPGYPFNVRSHRIAYAVLIRQVPPELVVDHLCKNRLCVNPMHLDAVPQRVNLLRADTFQARNAAKTHCDSGHEFTPENTYNPPGPLKRYCRTCRREAERRIRQRRKQALLARG